MDDHERNSLFSLARRITAIAFVALLLVLAVGVSAGVEASKTWHTSGAAILDVVPAGATYTPTGTPTISPPHTGTPSPVTPSSTATASSPTITPTVGSPTATASPTVNPDCGLAWRPVSTPYDGILYDVQAISANDVWAVGDHGAMRWDGTAWGIVVPTSGIDLRGVSALASNDVWLAGFSGVYHWNGAALEHSYQTTTGEVLYGITALTDSDVWAVGRHLMPSDPVAHSVHWNGLQWSSVEAPNPERYGVLTSISAVDSSHVWAVGGFSPSVSALVLRWDGNQWNIEIPPWNDQAGLNGVVALSSTNVWAVGGKGSNLPDSLVGHYDGSTWSENASPNVGRLNDVSATTPNDIWAVGSGGILHYDGTTWTQVPSPPGTLYGVDGVASDDVWAVGDHAVLHYSRDMFGDVPPSSPFYPWIQCLACQGIINGYPDGTFKPNLNVSRGQLSKIVSNSAGFSDPQTGQKFQDVPVGSTFQVYIERLSTRGYINGYPCGGPGEPCVPPDNLPYFRPNNNASRGQIAKITSNAAGYTDPAVGQTFEDVLPGSTFYDFIQRLGSRGYIGGYPCGGPGEPCEPPENRMYFRPGNNATRGQTSKIVSKTFFPNCQLPIRR